jgi:transposase
MFIASYAGPRHIDAAVGGYRQLEPGDYRYSRWCELYRAWGGRLSPTMRQAHPAGERMFVDSAGQTVDLIDGRSAEIQPAQIFVAVMGASNYTYAEATLARSLPDWIGTHVAALGFMGSVPAQLVPDNPKVGVDHADWYELGLNRTYLDRASHYDAAILPTRIRKLPDKGRGRALVIERWIPFEVDHDFSAILVVPARLSERGETPGSTSPPNRSQ